MVSLEQQLLELVNGVDPFIAAGIILGVVIILAVFLGYAAVPLIQRVVSLTESEYDDIILRSVKRPVFLTIILLGSYAATLPLDVGSNVRDPFFGIIVTIVVIEWGWQSASISRELTEEIRENREDDVGFVPILQNVLNLVVASVGILVIMSAWDINIAPFLASAGILGIVIGFAAKDTVANFFGGVALYFDNTYRVGDFITLEDGTEGTVERITIRSTIIRTRDDVYVTVPNSVLNSSQVENQSAPNEMRRLVLPVSFKYGSDEEQIHNVLLDAAMEHSDVLDSPEPRPRLRNFGDNGIEYDLLIWIAEPEPAPRIRHEVNEKIYRRCEDDDLVIPFPQRTLHTGDDRVSIPPAQEDE